MNISIYKLRENITLLLINVEDLKCYRHKHYAYKHSSRFYLCTLHL